MEMAKTAVGHIKIIKMKTKVPTIFSLIKMGLGYGKIKGTAKAKIIILMATMITWRKLHFAWKIYYLMKSKDCNVALIVL